MMEWCFNESLIERDNSWKTVIRFCEIRNSKK